MEPFATCVRGFYPVADPCSALLNPLKDLGRLAFRSGFGSLYSNFKRNNMVQAATWHLIKYWENIWNIYVIVKPYPGGLRNTWQETVRSGPGRCQLRGTHNAREWSSKA